MAWFIPLLQCSHYGATQSYAGLLLPALNQSMAAPTGTETEPPAPTSGSSAFTTSATVTGLTGSSGILTLQNNGADDLTFTADGTKTFATAIVDGGTYAVTVSTQPGDRTCTVSAGNGSILSADVAVTVSCVGAKRIWITAATANGAILGGGITQADTLCNSAGDGNWPGSGTYKALLVDGTRAACGNANCSPAGGQVAWVFSADTSYMRASDSAPIFTTNADSIFTFGTLTNAFGPAGSAWTGLNADWTVGNNCSNWTSNTMGGGAANQGERGNTAATNSDVLNGGSGSPQCSTARAFICVEQ